jgi:hypothetical protein
MPRDHNLQLSGRQEVRHRKIIIQGKGDTPDPIITIRRLDE